MRDALTIPPLAIERHDRIANPGPEPSDVKEIGPSVALADHRQICSPRPTVGFSRWGRSDQGPRGTMRYTAVDMAALPGTGGAVPAHADTVIIGGSVYTGGAGGQADALAVAGGRVLAVGSAADVGALIGADTRVIRADGRLVTPGFVDSHVHFLTGGAKLSSVQLRDAATPEDFAVRIGTYASNAETGAWITGGDWDHEAWGGRLPQRAWIDAVTPDNPVWVNRLDGHMALANSVALSMAGITAATDDIDGGTIVRDAETGEPTGILKDEAMVLMLEAIPDRSDAELDDALIAAAGHALSNGVTQVHDMAGWRDLETYRRARASGDLPLRIYSAVPMSSWTAMRDYIEAEGQGDTRLWWGALKAFVDGSLGSTTAWFHDPYCDEPHNRGLAVTDLGELRHWIHEADRARLHLIVHAIGDRANDWLLDTYQAAATANGPRDRRFRVEHAQHLSQGAIRRFSSQDVVASMQPFHAVDDGRWAEKRIGGGRLGTTYAFRSLLDAGARLAFGSDWTVAPMNVLAGVHAATCRRTLDGRNPDGWVPEQKIGAMEALHAYTAGGAYAGFADGFTGTLRRGAHADLVVLSQNLFEIDPVGVGSVLVDMTMVEGEIAYERE